MTDDPSCLPEARQHFDALEVLLRTARNEGFEEGQAAGYQMAFTEGAHAMLEALHQRDYEVLSRLLGERFKPAVPTASSTKEQQTFDPGLTSGVSVQQPSVADVREAVREHTSTVQQPLDYLITQVGLGNRLAGLLLDFGIRTVGQLMDTSSSKLQRIPGFKKKHLEQIDRLVSVHHLERWGRDPGLESRVWNYRPGAA